MSEDTYPARRLRIASILDPSTVFVSPSNVELSKAVYSSKQTIGGLNYLDAIKIYNGCVHPQTGETIFTPLRISWILPSNVLVTTAMILASTTGNRYLISASQVLNQSYNTAHYYANRNTSNPDSLYKIAGSYVAAVGCSIGVAGGLEGIARKSVNMAMWRTFNPFIAVACGTSVNMACMRSSELISGVEIFDSKTKESLGQNVQAGRIGVGVSILGRVLTAAAPLTVPQILANYMNKTVFKSMPRFHTPFYVVYLAGVIQVSTPWTLGLFRQRYEVERVEVGVEGEGRVEWNRGM
ncbi:hypothetical protein TL16_g10376 [Triparma laevis f. inornata]|uniref:Uncharacterized protein n=1 Tax=Triparma laevis f. inornata TaxID=1714386 RepID=A0A9W7BGT7_9STRA|nr:hypothetical protein TL16_g10376 [Triparma laevis f. inornata]